MAVFTHRLDLGGGQLYLQDLLRPLLAEHDVTCLVVSQYDGPLRAELERLGAVVEVLDYPVHSAAAYERQVDLIADLVRDHGSNIVLANTMVAAIGADVARRLDLPAIWAIHESYCLDDFWVAAYGDDGIAAPVRSCIRRALASTAAAVFEADATRAAYRGALDADRMVTVPYGIAVGGIDEFRAGHDRDQLRQSLGLDPHATVLLCIGTFEARKAQAALALAFAEAAVGFPGTVLVLVGDTDNRRARAPGAGRPALPRPPIAPGAHRPRPIPLVPRGRRVHAGLGHRIDAPVAAGGDGVRAPRCRGVGLGYTGVGDRWRQRVAVRATRPRRRVLGHPLPAVLTARGAVADRPRRGRR